MEVRVEDGADSHYVPPVRRDDWTLPLLLGEVAAKGKLLARGEM